MNDQLSAQQRRRFIQETTTTHFALNIYQKTTFISQLTSCGIFIFKTTSKGLFILRISLMQRGYYEEYFLSLREYGRDLYDNKWENTISPGDIV